MSSLPKASDNEEEVKSYVIHTLISKYGTSPDFASQCAQRWQLGRGSELLSARLEYLQEIFGTDVGFCLFQSIREDEDASWQHSVAGTFSECEFSINTKFAVLRDVYSKLNRFSRPYDMFCCSITQKPGSVHTCRANEGNRAYVTMDIVLIPSLIMVAVYLSLLLFGVSLINYAYRRPRMDRLMTGDIIRKLFFIALFAAWEAR